jgi:hypothetical protein
MTLLAEVIESHGSAELWRQLRRFCAGAPINGALLAGKGKADALKDVVIEGNVRDHFLRFTGFAAPYRRATADVAPIEGHVPFTHRNAFTGTDVLFRPAG